MKYAKISAAVIAATTMMSGSAFAALGYPTAANVDVELRMSGATASDKTLKNLFTGQYCDPATTSTFTATNFTAYFCTIPGGTLAGHPNDTNVLVRKNSDGGSFNGTVPVLDTLDEGQIKLAAPTCVETVPGNNSAYTCTQNPSDLVDLSTHAGLSDEEPTLFVPPNVGAGSSAFPSGRLAELNWKVVGALAFGVPVTNGLYIALQKAQGLDADLDNDGVEEAQNETASADAIAANMPSLTREQVASLITGSIPDWSKVYYKHPTTGVRTPLTAFGAPADNRVFVCRRVNGSGTQAQMNAMYLNTPCSADGDNPAVDTSACVGTKEEDTFGGALCTPSKWVDVIVDSGAPVIHENAGSGNVTNCLNGVQDSDAWGLGVQSLEKDSTKWAFIKINGVEPTLEKVASGEYFNWAASSMQWRNNLVTIMNGEPVEPGAFKSGNGAYAVALLNDMRDGLSSPTVLNVLNKNYPFGRSGWLAPNPEVGQTRTPFNVNMPVMQYTRGGKTCRVQKAISDVDFGA